MIADLGGRTALVTGAAAVGSIGESIVEVMARQGATVAAADIDREGVERLAERLSPATVLPVEMDVSSSESVARAVADVTRELGDVDVLVNNAGVLGGAGPEAWTTTFQVNVMGTVYCTEAVLPAMKARRFGKIVGIASIAAHASRRTEGAYASSKAAVLRYIKGISLGLAAYNINVNAVCPGILWTPLNEAYWANPVEHGDEYARMSPYEAFLKYYAEIVPLGRPQSPVDVANVVAFLASEDARNISGQCIHVDGGKVCE
jgi:NAD(P)-dependent dehydrogenase (short-subunit alcohol dehydrogenase family)